MNVLTFEQIGSNEIEVELSELVMIPSELIINGQSLLEKDVKHAPFSPVDANNQTAALLTCAGEFMPVYIDVNTLKSMYPEKSDRANAIVFYATQTGENNWWLRQDWENYIDLDFSITIDEKNKFDDITTLDVSLTYDRETNNVTCFVGINYCDGMLDDTVTIVVNDDLENSDNVANIELCEFNKEVTREMFENFLHNNKEFNRVIKGVFALVN